MFRFTARSTLFVIAFAGVGGLAGCGGLGDDRYDQTAEALGAASYADSSNAGLAVKLEWTGDVGKLKIEVSGERGGDWKVEEGDAGTQRVNGKVHYELQSERKDKEAGDETKFHFSYEAQYKDVIIRTSDRVLIGGTVEYDIKAKLSEKTDTTKVKEEWQIKGKVTYDETGEGTLLLDESYKYKMKANGEVTVESR